MEIIIAVAQAMLTVSGLALSAFYVQRCLSGGSLSALPRGTAHVGNWGGSPEQVRCVAFLSFLHPPALVAAPDCWCHVRLKVEAHWLWETRFFWAMVTLYSGITCPFRKSLPGQVNSSPKTRLRTSRPLALSQTHLGRRWNKDGLPEHSACVS